MTHHSHHKFPYPAQPVPASQRHRAFKSARLDGSRAREIKRDTSVFPPKIFRILGDLWLPLWFLLWYPRIMLSQKCRVCGERHPLGPCPTGRGRSGSSASDTPREAALEKRTPAVRSDSRSGPEVGRVNVRERPMREPAERGSAPQAEAVGVTAGETASVLPNVARGGLFIAPPGECAYCDRRREQKAAAMRALRDRKAKADG